MSGGHYDYKQYAIRDIADQLEEDIKTNGVKDEFGYSRSYSKKTITEFKKALKLLKKAEIYVIRIDWLISDDDGEDTFHKRLKEDLENL